MVMPSYHLAGWAGSVRGVTVIIYDCAHKNHEPIQNQHFLLPRKNCCPTFLCHLYKFQSKRITY